MSELYPVVILAGGLATRLRPLTEKIPKALIEINGEPFIAHQLHLLKYQGVSQVIICAGYLGQQIQDYLGDGQVFGLMVDYVFDGDSLLGTAGALKKALSKLPQDFFVMYGDSYLLCNYAAVQQAYLSATTLGLMTVFHNQNLGDASNVEFNAAKIIAYDKVKRTSKMQYIDYGLGILNQAAFGQIPENTYYDLAKLYQTLLTNGQLAAYEVAERFYEVGSFAGITDISYYLAHQCL